jgi:hypothetical protein
MSRTFKSDPYLEVVNSLIAQGRVYCDERNERDECDAEHEDSEIGNSND